MRALPDDDDLIENAAGCAQFRPLSMGDEDEDENLRECIKLNVCKPLRERITKLERRDHADDCDYVTKRLLTGDIETCTCGSPDWCDWARERIEELEAALK